MREAKKREDFILFSQIVTLINQKEHLTLSGLHKIVKKVFNDDTNVNFVAYKKKAKTGRVG